MSLDPTSADDNPSDATSLNVPFSPPLSDSVSFASVTVSHSDSGPSDLGLPPIKRQRTDDALVDATLASLLPLSPPPAILPAGLIEPLDSLLALPVPSAAVSPSDEQLSDEQQRNQRREDKRRRRQRNTAADDDYQPMLLGQGAEEEDDEMTLLMDDMQRVEGEEEDELLALQADAEVDIEQLRQQMRQAEADGEEEEEEEGEEEEEEEEGSEYSDEDDEDRIDINDLPRLKDLQALQHTAVAAGLPPPTSLLDPTSLNTPFPPKQRVEIVVDDEEGTAVKAAEAVVKVASGTTGSGEEVKVEEVTVRLPADSVAYTVSHPLITETAETMASAAITEKSEEEEKVKQPNVAVEEAVAEEKREVAVVVEVDDVTDRERILSQELSISVAELREMDRQYAQDRAATVQRQTARRSHREQHTTVVDAEDNKGYSSSSSSSSSPSSSSDSSDSDADDYYESYSSVTTTTVSYPHPHITPYPAKSSRVGPTYQAYPLPPVLPSDEAKAAECALHVAEEGQLVVLSAEEAERAAPEGDMYWEVAEVRRRRREMREEMVRKRLEQQQAAAEAAGEATTESIVVPVPVVSGVDEGVEVQQPTVVRSQRSSARRAREFIASVAASSGSENESGTEAALAAANEVRVGGTWQVVDAVVDAVALGGGAAEPGGGNVSEVGNVSISVST